MNEGLKKFEELWKNDTAFQEKLKSAMESYTGEQTEKAVFEGVLTPLAKEYGISASFEEFQKYINSIPTEERELSQDEIDQVAGGTKGFGANVCMGVGIGMGGSIGQSGGVCVGFGVGKINACAGDGVNPF